MRQRTTCCSRSLGIRARRCWLIAGKKHPSAIAFGLPTSAITSESGASHRIVDVCPAALAPELGDARVQIGTLHVDDAVEHLGDIIHVVDHEYLVIMFLHLSQKLDELFPMFPVLVPKHLVE